MRTLYLLVLLITAVLPSAAMADSFTFTLAASGDMLGYVNPCPS